MNDCKEKLEKFKSNQDSSFAKEQGKIKSIFDDKKKLNLFLLADAADEATAKNATKVEKSNNEKTSKGGDKNDN